MNRPTAHVSIDVDSIDVHLSGYGITRPPCDLVYDVAVERILDLLSRHRIRATFFIVARDVERHRAVVARIAGAGHEVASHSMTHRLPFATLNGRDLRYELEESRVRLEDVTGKRVLGFRAPGWDIQGRQLRAIADAGYAYDASLLPSFGLAVGKLMKRARSTREGRDVALWASVKTAFGPRTPYRPFADRPDFREFPVAVSPRLRIPFVHTSWHLLPTGMCERIYVALKRQGATLSYQFHAVDVLGLTEDRVDDRMSRHPGMRLSLDRRLSVLESALSRVVADYRVQLYADTVSLEPLGSR